MIYGILDRIHRFSVSIATQVSLLIKIHGPFFHGKHKDKRATSTHLSNTLWKLALLLNAIASAETSLDWLDCSVSQRISKLSQNLQVFLLNLANYPIILGTILKGDINDWLSCPLIIWQWTSLLFSVVRYTKIHFNAGTISLHAEGAEDHKRN